MPEIDAAPQRPDRDVLALDAGDAGDLHESRGLADAHRLALDAESVALLAGLIAAHGRRGGLVIAASHVDFGLAGAFTLDLGALAGTVAA